MTTQLSDVISNISDDINRTDLNTQIVKAINRAISQYEAERFWFQETTATYNTIANQQSYGTSDAGFPSDIQEINDPVRITVSSTFIPSLKRITHAELLRRDVGAFASTQPFDWSWYQGKMFFYPRPSVVLPVTIPYQKLYSDLSNNTDTNDWLTYALELIESRARVWLYAHVIQDDGRAQAAEKDELKALMSLQEKNRKFVSTGRIRATQF